MIFACDVNLGFPTDDPEWAAFFRDHGWRTVNYDDMGKLTATLKAHQPGRGIHAGGELLLSQG